MVKIKTLILLLTTGTRTQAREWTSIWIWASEVTFSTGSLRIELLICDHVRADYDANDNVTGRINSSEVNLLSSCCAFH